jgi:hypothetical protein
MSVHLSAACAPVCRCISRTRGRQEDRTHCRSPLLMRPCLQVHRSRTLKPAGCPAGLRYAVAAAAGERARGCTSCCTSNQAPFMKLNPVAAWNDSPCDTLTVHCRWGIHWQLKQFAAVQTAAAPWSALTAVSLSACAVAGSVLAGDKRPKGGLARALCGHATCAGRATYTLWATCMPALLLRA